MKHCTRYITLLFLLAGGMVWAQTEVTISNSETWKNTELAPYTGKVVRFATPFYVTNNYYNNRLTIAPRRIYSATNQALPASTEYNHLLSANATGQITLTNVEGYHRMGERLLNLTVYVSSNNSVQLRSCDWAGNTRAELEQGYDSAAVDMLGEHTLLVCAMNCEYYLTEQFGYMGPRNEAEHQKQRAKVSAALAKISADVYGLVEIQQGQRALAEIAQDLRSLTKHPYAYVNDGGSADGTYTKSGYVYRSDVVQPYGSIRNNETGVKNRKKTQGFMEIATGEKFIFSINHFKAKSGSGSGDNADKGDGQSTYNGTRKQEAQSVLDSYEKDRVLFGDDDILIMGDLNAYAKEDPITILREGGMIDLHRAFHADSSYSYTYHGEAGYLDHALCNSTLYPQVTGMTAYHINSDEDDSYTYNRSNDLSMFRCSDHDPVLVGLRLDSTLTYNPEVRLYNTISNTDDTGQVYYEFTTPHILNANGGYYIVYQMDGRVVKQSPITSSNEEITGLSQGIYILNIYGQGTCLPTKLIVR